MSTPRFNGVGPTCPVGGQAHGPLLILSTPDRWFCPHSDHTPPGHPSLRAAIYTEADWSRPEHERRAP